MFSYPETMNTLVSSHTEGVYLPNFHGGRVIEEELNRSGSNNTALMAARYSYSL